jgi:EAL domain-containing protein (putative c-di-GMP-specific phosphodiesterase class I)/GGDEF domain-containing protein
VTDVARIVSASLLKHDDALADLLDDIIRNRLLHALFQPIIATRGGEIIGYEGLIRGPEGSPLHMPAWLFDVAGRYGLQSEIEHLSREVVAETFVRLGFAGKLFLNVSPDMLTVGSMESDGFTSYLAALGLSPERVIIELTENQRTHDFSSMRGALLHFRRQGFEIAIDDLGEGFSSLRLWSELRPEVVKIDKHFIHGINQDPLKLAFVKAIQQIATCCGSQVIAEGIESRQDFTIVRDLGIAYGQGYFIARPSAQPAVEAEAREALQCSGLAVYPGTGGVSNRRVTARKLVVRIAPVAPEVENGEVYEILKRDSDLVSLPVVKDGVPVGLIDRYALIDQFARPYYRELFGRKPCSTFMQTAPLIVEHDLGIQEVSALVAARHPRHLAEGFIVTENGRYLGTGNARDLLLEITELQITAARYANPLTQLPGNVPISEHIERLLSADVAFCACYCDIDGFKAFNDVYGYYRGDELICLTANLLSEQCDPERDFIGHIGGDDFLVIFQALDWERRSRTLLERFDSLIPGLISEGDRERGGLTTESRRGERLLQPFPTLSIGAVVIQPNQGTSHFEVSAAAAEAKKQAKRIEGSALFIERRALG